MQSLAHPGTWGGAPPDPLLTTAPPLEGYDPFSPWVAYAAAHPDARDIVVAGPYRSTAPGAILEPELIQKMRGEAPPVARRLAVCLLYRMWERFYFPGTPTEICPVLTRPLEIPPMAFTIPAGSSRVLEMIIQGVADGQMVLNRFHLTVDNVSGADITSTLILTTLRERFRINMLQDLASTYRVAWYLLKQISGFGTPAPGINYVNQAILRGVEADVGTTVGDALPVYVAATVQLKTGTLGRGSTGSKRIGPLVESDTTADRPNFLTAGRRTTIETDAAAWLQPIAIAGTNIATVVLFAIRGSGNDPNDPITWVNFLAPVDQVVCNLRLGSQISRKTRSDAA